MKKILFCSLILCLGINGSYAEDSEDHVCYGNICAVYPNGGDVEQKKCLKEANASNFNEKWMEEGSACDADDAKIGRCFQQKNNKKQRVMSCAAKICNDDSVLWLHKNKKGKYDSYGRCRKKDWLQENICTVGQEKCNSCKGKCELKVVKYKNGDFGETDAYYDDALCVCVAEKEEETCKYTFTATVTCYTNGQTTTYNGRAFEVPKSKFKDGKCVDTTVAQQFSEWYLQQRTEVQQWFNANCPQQPGSDVSINTVTNIELQNAKSKVDSFIASVKSSKRDVWKDAEGKFNTARLASDLTAGIVLGTVGGVVSGVVIKKKQVEKGFEALHCTVGGQKVSNWGDEFVVGLQR
jgi:hypothetical protein